MTLTIMAHQDPTKHFKKYLFQLFHLFQPMKTTDFFADEGPTTCSWNCSTLVLNSSEQIEFSGFDHGRHQQRWRQNTMNCYAFCTCGTSQLEIIYT